MVSCSVPTGRDKPKLPGFLEDYSFVADGLLALYEATFERRWLDSAVELADQMISQFWDEGAEAFYDTGRGHEELVVRPRDVFDNAQPCGGSVASDLLTRLSVVTGNEDYVSKAVGPLRAMAELMGRAPAGTGRWLAALDFYLSTPKEIAVIGPSSDPRDGRFAQNSQRPLSCQSRGRGGQRRRRCSSLRPAPPRGTRHGRRKTDGLRLRELRLPVASHQPGGTGPTAKRTGNCPQVALRNRRGAC